MMNNKLNGGFFSKIKRRLLIFFAVLGPGIITAVADNDAGGVATYMVAASIYGMASQFLILPETLLLALTQEIGARIAIITKKGLADLIREYYGVRISLLIFILYFIVNQGVVLQNISGLKAALQLFNLPWQIGLILMCFVLVLITIKFDYKKLEKIFLLMIVFYISYVLVVWIVKPDFKEAIMESFIWPRKIKISLTYLFSRIAVLGTTITAWGQFFVHSYIIDKNIDEQNLQYERMDVFIGAFLTNFFSFMMALAVASTLFKNGIIISDGYAAAIALKPIAGELAYLLFATGLFGASILGLTIVPLATAYVFSEFFGYEGSLDTDFKKSKLFYSFFILQIVIGLIIALFPHTSLFKLTLYVDFLNGALLPIIFYFLITFSENKNIMGEKYVSKGIGSFFIKLSAIIILVTVIISFIGKIFHII